MKRIMAFITALALLLSMTGSALADGAAAPYRTGSAAHTHNWVLQDIDYTGCTSPAYYVYVCSCGESKVEERPGPGHDYKQTIVQAPTCTEGGYASYTCTRCGDSYREQLKALGHNWSSWKQTQKPTCVQDGTEERTCSRCGKKESRTVAANGSHEWGDWKVDEPGTCVTLELRERKCIRCGTIDYSYWGYGDHSWGEWETVREPSDGQKGLRRRVCKYSASHVEEEEFDADGNTFGGVTAAPIPDVPAPDSPDPTPGMPAAVTPEITEDYTYPYIDLDIVHPDGPFKPGDSFEATLTLRSSSSIMLYLVGYYAVLGSEETDAGLPIPATLAPYEEYSWTQTIYVTEADFQDSDTLNRYWGAEYSNGKGYSDVDTATLSVPLTTGEAPEPGVSDEPVEFLVLSFVQTSAVQSAYMEGNDVTFDVTLENKGQTDLFDCQVQMDDQIMMDKIVYGYLAAGASTTRTFTAHIIGAHEDAGHALISWSGWGYDASGMPIYSNDEQIDLPTAISVPPDPGPVVMYALELREEWVDGPTLLNLHDSAEIKLTAVNNSDETLYDVRIFEDWDSGASFSTNAAPLAPGEEFKVTSNVYITLDDWNYAKANGGEVYAHWKAVGYTENQVDVTSNVCDERFVIVHEEGTDEGELAIVSVNAESGAGKQAGDWIGCEVTVKNTGKASVLFNELIVSSAVAGDEYDFSAFPIAAGQTIAPDESATGTVLVKVTDGDMGAGALRRTFEARYDFDGMEYVTNAKSVDVPLDIYGHETEDGPELSLYVVSLDAEPFSFDDAGQTGTKTYRAVVSNIGKERCDVSDIVITTAGGTFTQSFGPYPLFPGDDTPDLYLYNSFDAGELDTNGKLHISFIAHGEWGEKTYSSNPVEFTHDVSGDPPVPPVESGVAIHKVENSASANPNGYVLGEQVSYWFVVANNSDVDLPAVSIYDPLFGSDPVAVISVPAHGHNYDVVFSHSVTQQDVDNKQIVNTATAKWTDPETGEERTAVSDTVIVPTLDPNNDVGNVSIYITLEKGPDNGSYYVKGEVVPIRVDWANSSKVQLQYVSVYDYEAMMLGVAPVTGGYLADDIVMNPGDTGTFSFNYTVSDCDAELTKYIYDWAYISGYDSEGHYYYAEDEQKRDADIDAPDPEIKTPELKVEKVEISKPANGKYYVEGETITYNIFVTNTGNAELTDVTVGDSLSDTFMGAFATITTLHPTETYKYKFSYVVKAEDVAAGKVVNYGLGYYTCGMLIDVPVVSDPVESPTAPDPVPVPPKTPTGTIKTPIVAEGKEDACILTLKNRVDGTAEYEQHLCKKHAALYAAAKDSNTAAAWRQAADQWRAELEEMYQLILKASTGSARMTVMADRATFYAYVDVYKAMIQAMDYRSAESAAAEKAAAEMMMGQCAELCYLIHYAPDARMDSLVTGSYGAETAGGPAGTKCFISAVPVDDSTLRFTERLCDEHIVQDRYALSLVRQARTRVGFAEAFINARRSWQSALNAQVSAQYKSAEKETRRVISACRNLFDSLLKNREAFYTYLYPNNPEIVAEIMNRSVVVDVMRRCK
ncbi:MAG: hypothetical protein IKQ41_01995 [Clostridia bacterium]|nr:hypothetical protein [Clostridia bacterium]